MRSLSLALLLAATVGAASASPPAAPAAGAPEGAKARPPAVVLDIDRDINAVTAEFLQRALRDAETSGAPVVVLRLNTPGGRLDATRDITKSILASRVPVVGWVTPSGAQAASAGFLVLMACDVAAMSPGTNTGAASVVGGQGEELPKTIGRKMTEDAAALLRSVAAPRGRPVETAVKAITDALSWSDAEALEKKLVEVSARDLPELLVQLDGRTVKRVGRPDELLRTAGLSFLEKRMTPLQRALGVVASPVLAGLLLMLGLVGLYAEMQSPGAIFPGVFGGICLLLGLYAMSVLPTNGAGIGLILLGLLFFFLEVKLASHGLFAIGGGLSMVLGAALLFHRDPLAPRGDLWFLVGGALAASAILAALSLAALRVQGLPARVGAESLVGLVVSARTAIHTEGKVFVDGALWNARSQVPVEAGAPVEIVSVDGLTLVVRPSERSPA